MGTQGECVRQILPYGMGNDELPLPSQKWSERWQGMLEE